MKTKRKVKPVRAVGMWAIDHGSGICTICGFRLTRKAARAQARALGRPLARVIPVTITPRKR